MVTVRKEVKIVKKEVVRVSVYLIPQPQQHWALQQAILQQLLLSCLLQW